MKWLADWLFHLVENFWSALWDDEDDYPRDWR